MKIELRRRMFCPKCKWFEKGTIVPLIPTSDYGESESCPKCGNILMLDSIVELMSLHNSITQNRSKED